MNSTEYDWKCDRTLIEVEVQDAGKVPTVVVHSGGAGHNVHKAEATHEDTTLHTAFVDDEPLFRPIKPEPECVDDTDAVPPQFISTEVVSRDDGLSSTIQATHELEVCSTAHDGKRSTIFDNGENVPCASSVPARFKRQTKTKSVSCRSTAITAKRTRLEKEFEIAEPVLGDEEDDTPEPVIIAGVDSDRKWVELVNYSNEEITLTGWSLLAVWKGAQMGYCPIKGSVKLPPHGKIKVKSDLPVRRDSVNLSLLDSNLEERSIISYALVDVTDVE